MESFCPHDLQRDQCDHIRQQHRTYTQSENEFFTLEAEPGKSITAERCGDSSADHGGYDDLHRVLEVSQERKVFKCLFII